MPSLKKVAFQFHECIDVLDQNVATICQGVSKLPRLESVKLSFCGCYHVTGKGIENLSLSKSKSLQAAFLDFALCGKINDVSVGIIIQSLQALPYLQNIGLNFMCASVTDPGLIHLEQGLLQMKDLKSLCFNFQNCEKITEKGILSLINALNSFAKSLEKLDLNFRNNPFIGDDSLSSFEEFFKQAKALDSIRMILHDCPQITSKSLESLCSSLQGLSLIKNLELDLSNFTEMNDETLRALGAILKGKSLLEDMKMHFCFCQNITDVGLEYFSEGLKQARSLKNLSLAVILYFIEKDQNNNIERFQKITDQGLKSLFQALKEMVSLESLELDFEGCPQIKGEELNILTGSLGNSIKKVTLNFERCQVNKESVDNLRKSLSEDFKMKEDYVQDFWFILSSVK